MLPTNISTNTYMALRYVPTIKLSSKRYLPVIRSSADDSGGGSTEVSGPAEEFGKLAAAFRRRLVIGAAAASLVAVGANFGGLTSLLLGISPNSGRALRLDVLYPVNGFTRCLDLTNGFEFIYPSSWVGDQTLLYREAFKAESQRSLDPPPLNGSLRPTRYVNEPVKAFGPPGSNGELNVSVIVSPVALDFSIETFGGPKEVGELVLKRIAKSRRGMDIKATLIDASLREDSENKINYYNLEFAVEGPSFKRHNIAVCCVKDGKLFTLNAQAPESAWVRVRGDFSEMADSFRLMASSGRRKNKFSQFSNLSRFSPSSSEAFISTDMKCKHGTNVTSRHVD